MVTVTVDRPAAFIWRLLKCCFTHRSEAGYYIRPQQQKNINKRQPYIDLLYGMPNICIFSKGARRLWHELLITQFAYSSGWLHNNIDIKAAVPLYLIYL